MSTDVRIIPFNKINWSFVSKPDVVALKHIGLYRRIRTTLFILCSCILVLPTLYAPFILVGRIEIETETHDFNIFK